MLLPWIICLAVHRNLSASALIQHKQLANVLGHQPSPLGDPAAEIAIAVSDDEVAPENQFCRNDFHRVLASILNATQATIMISLRMLL
jgi:hypothetical protein